MKSLTKKINHFVLKRIKLIEMTGVVMRISSFTLVSWLGPNSPFMFVWFFNTIDAIMLVWCSTLKKESAYILLNGFWVIIGVIGIVRASGMLH